MSTTFNLATVLTGCAQILDTIKQEWKESWSDWDQQIRNGITEQLEHIYSCGQPSRDAVLLQLCDDPSIIYYGPHQCATCNKRICRVEQAQGGMAFDYPEGIIYPNTNWTQHVCQGETNGNANN